MPFDEYKSGREIGKRVSGANCRHEYGLEFMKVTGQRVCAYCGLDLTSSFEAWLTQCLDHVVPASVCKDLGIKPEWQDDNTNKVLACAACNGFNNRWKPDWKPEPIRTEQEFLDLRDRVFKERFWGVHERRERERAVFHQRKWEK